MKDYVIKLFYNYDSYDSSLYTVKTEIEDEEELITKFLNKIIVLEDLKEAKDLKIDFKNKRFVIRFPNNEEGYSWEIEEMEYIEV